MMSCQISQLIDKRYHENRWQIILCFWRNINVRFGNKIVSYNEKGKSLFHSLESQHLFDSNVGFLFLNGLQNKIHSKPIIQLYESKIFSKK